MSNRGKAYVIPRSMVKTKVTTSLILSRKKNALLLFEAKRASVVGCFVSAFVLLLLAWQVSFKVNANENAYITVEQNIVPVFDLNDDEHDFDWLLPVTPSLPITVFTTLRKINAVDSFYSHALSVPQSRAPPSIL
jgi:hypothetical protein